MIDIIDKFRGPYNFLSNFYSVEIEFEGLIYASVEHAYQAAKTTDLNIKKKFTTDYSMSAKTSKIEGALIDKTKRPDWDVVKLSVMKQLVEYKFTKYPKLRNLLLSTGDAVLVEGNWWKDHFWGVCNGVGENHLGRILEEVRETLRTNI